MACARGRIRGLTRPYVRLHASGPAVLWALDRILLLPADFLERFDAEQRSLILRHEQCTMFAAAIRWWSLLAEIALAALWFHPLAWLAMPRFRLDQELGLRRTRAMQQLPSDETRYARTLLHSTGHGPTPVLIPWLDPPQLKERLTMIRRPKVSALRRRLGYPVLIAAMAVCSISLQAAPLTACTGRRKLRPQLQPAPAAALSESLHSQKEEGTVVLKVLVDPQGLVKSVDYDPKASTTTSASLIGAASDAAFKWHFNPATEHGKPIESYARVPVEFSLSPLPDAAPGIQHARIRPVPENFLPSH